MTDTLTHESISLPSRSRPPRTTRHAAPVETVPSVEERRLLVADRPITFDEWVKRKDEALYELNGGSLVEKMAASIEHELLFIWLATLMNAYASHRGLGQVLGSRTAVRITQFNGRLPDIVFVRKQRSRALRKRGIYAEPDLVVEIRSPGDHASEMTALEAEYRTIGVAELWLIDPQKKRVRVLRRTKEGYTEEEVREGALTSSAIEGFTIQADWLWTDDRPDVFGLLQQMLRVEG